MTVRQTKGRTMRSRSRLLGVLVPGLLAICLARGRGVRREQQFEHLRAARPAAAARAVRAERVERQRRAGQVSGRVTAAPATAKKGGTLTAIANGDVDYIDPGAAYYQPTYMIDLAVDSPLMGWPPNDTAAPVPLLASAAAGDHQLRQDDHVPHQAEHPLQPATRRRHRLEQAGRLARREVRDRARSPARRAERLSGAVLRRPRRSLAGPGRGQEGPDEGAEHQRASRPRTRRRSCST